MGGNTGTDAFGPGPDSEPARPRPRRGQKVLPAFLVFFAVVLVVFCVVLAVGGK